MQKRTLRPRIVMTSQDHQQLIELAMAGGGPSTDAAEALLDEVERARVVSEKAISADVVRMGSVVTYRAEDQERVVTLVYPVDADISEGRVSVLTPVGAALIGLTKGQSITWVARDGRKHVLTILDVTHPASAALEA